MVAYTLEYIPTYFGQLSTAMHVQIVTCIRGRFMDPNAGKHDNQYSTEKAENVYNVTWSDVAQAKWPAPPKACTKCGAKMAKKPY